MKKRNQSGFSLVELMIVLVIIMVVSALAMPNVIRGIGTLRLRGAGSNMSGLIQKARIEAVRTNRIQQLKFANVNGALLLYVDGPAVGTYTAYNDTPDPHEAVVQVPDSISFDDGSGAPAANFTSNATTLLGYTQTASTTSPINLAFNQRGLPCTPDATPPTVCTIPAKYVYFLKSTGPYGGGWLAISITPAGRIRVWSWDGSNWT
jgi:prepilin-type N-terminal cleavage/methylation domain-containing protein